MASRRFETLAVSPVLRNHDDVHCEAIARRRVLPQFLVAAVDASRTHAIEDLDMVHDDRAVTRLQKMLNALRVSDM